MAATVDDGLMLIGGEMVRCAGRRLARVGESRQRAAARPGCERGRRGREPRRGGRARGAAGLGREVGVGAGGRAARARRRHSHARRADPRPRGARHRQHHRQAGRRRADRGRLSRVFRRARLRDQGRDGAGECAGTAFHAARALGRGGADRAVQSPVHVRGGAPRRAADGRQCRGREDPRDQPADRFDPRRAVPRAPARRRREHRARPRPAGGRYAGAASARAAHRLHRVGADRARDPARRRGVRGQACHARARRQEPVHRVSRCRSRQGGRDRGGRA